MIKRDNVRISADILEIVPVSVYEGKTYTQNIILKLPNSQVLEVADDEMLCRDADTGKIKNVYLIVVENSLQKIDKNWKKIVPCPACGKDFLGPDFEIYGCIKEILLPDDPEDINKKRDGILDVGVGNLIISLYGDDINLFNSGDSVHINGRIDLLAIE
jgi:hypothetical protein